MKLKQTEGVTGRYVTLSHCWGNNSLDFPTSTANMSQYLCEIPWSLIPETIKDAVAIIRKLGIRYFSVDSLCIVQDDERDWDLESAKMAAIYSSSVLTIAATHAADDKKGCFTTRWTAVEESLDLPRMNLQVLDLPVQMRKKGRSGQISVRLGHHLAHDNIMSLDLVSKTTSPLLNRGWVLQELLLSARILNIHAEEMVWQCRDSLACECSFLTPPGAREEIAGGSVSRMFSNDGTVGSQSVVAYKPFLEPHIYSLFGQLCRRNREFHVGKNGLILDHLTILKNEYDERDG